MVLIEENKRYEPGFLFSLLFLFGIGLFFISCASKPERQFVYQPTANAADELRNLQTEMDRAEGEQIAVFAPKSYAEAHKSWVKAKALQERGESNESVLKELGEARSYFEQAKSTAARSLRVLPEIADARENALISGAKLYHRPELDRADSKLKRVTGKFEKEENPKISLSDKTSLQQNYLDLELKGIKATRLGDAWSTLEAAKKMGAARLAPRTLASAESKVKNAELVIQTDRHNDALVTAASEDALNEARRLLRVTELSKRSGRSGNERMAIEIVDRDDRINRLNEQMALTEAQRRAQNAEYQAQLQQAQRSTAEAQESQRSAAAIAEMYRQAQEQFTDEEADVYRQGDNLIIRLKSIQFPSGVAEIPAASYQTLNKVQDVIADLDAGKVLIEGHTDSTGDAGLNQELSEQRAQAVAQYLDREDRQSGSATDEGLSIEARGYGYKYPIISNQTKEGRAQNRRVDIVIMPETVSQ